MALTNLVFHVFRQPASLRVILPEAIQNPTFFTSLLLLAYSHYDAMTSSKPSPEAISIKIENIRQINEQLEKPQTAASTANICSIMCLSGATTAYEMDALWDYKVHRNAIAMLVNVAGGTEVLKQTELGFCMVKMMVLRDQVEVAAWSSPYRDFPKSCLYPLPSFAQMGKKNGRIWKSPFYDPPFEQSPTNLPLGLQLLSLNMRTFMAILQNEKHEDLANRSQLQRIRTEIRKAIRMVPPLIGSKRMEHEHIYECCRLTSLIMLRAEEASLSLRAAVENTTILEDIRHSLQHTDTANLWGDHIGLLFWVIVVVNAAAFHTTHHLFTTSILTNLMFEVCYSDYDLDVALIPLEKMIWFEGYCKSGRSVLPIR